MKRRKISAIMGIAMAAGVFLAVWACSPPKPEPVRTVTIADGEIDPAK